MTEFNEDRLGHTRLATLHSLILDPRLKALSPKHTIEEYHQLETSMLQNGIEVSLVIDQATTICCDGMTRLEIAKKHPDKFPFIPIDERTFEGIEDMKRFVIENTLNRRQLTEPQKVSLALALKPILKKLAAARKKAGKTIGPKEPKGKTTEDLAKRAGVSPTTMFRYEKIQKEDPQLFKKVLSGEVKPRRAYDQIVMKENRNLPRMEIPEGEVNVIVYDPGWPFGNQVSGGSGNSGASQNYRVESIEEMKNNAVWKRAAKNSILFLWALPTHHIEATEVIQASGFNPLTKLYWDKMEMKQGFNFRNSVEECIVCTKGNVKAFAMTDQANIIHEKPVERIHSRKPEKFFEIFVEAAKRGLPGQKLNMIEVNATKARKGWITIGNQIQKDPVFDPTNPDKIIPWIKKKLEPRKTKMKWPSGKNCKCCSKCKQFHLDHNTSANDCVCKCHNHIILKVQKLKDGIEYKAGPGVSSGGDGGHYEPGKITDTDLERMIDSQIDWLEKSYNRPVLVKIVSDLRGWAKKKKTTNVLARLQIPKKKNPFMDKKKMKKLQTIYEKSKKKEITLACNDCLEIFHSKEALKEHKPKCKKLNYSKHVNAETGQAMFSCNKLCVHQVKK